MSTARNIAKNSIWLFIGTATLKIIAAFIVVLLVRHLGSDGYGQYSFANAFVGFFSVIAFFGFNSLIVRDLAKNKKLAGKYVNNILTIKIVFGIVAFLAMIAVAMITEKSFIVQLVIYIFGIEMIVGGFAETMISVFEAYQLMEYESITRILEKIVWAGLMLLVIYGKLGLVYVALATLIATTVGVGITYVFMKKKITGYKPVLDMKFFKKMMKEAWPFAMTSLFALIFFNIDVVMLSFMQGDAVVGWYSAATKLIDMLSILPNILFTTLYPVFSVFHKESKEKLKRSFHLSIRYMAIMAIPIVIGIFMLSDKIILLLYGSSFKESIGALQVLIFIVLLSFINNPTFVLLNAIGKQKITTINTAVSAVINVVLNLILIPILSYKGPAVATIISEIIFMLLCSYHLRKEGYGFNIFKLSIKPLIAGIIMGIFVYALHSLNMFIVIPIGAVIYLLALITIKEITPDDIALVKRMLQKKKVEA